MSASVTLPVASDAVKVERFRLMYISRKSARLIVQRIQMPASSVNEKLYDAILVAYAKIKNSVELDFLFAMDETSGILVTRESLTYYVMRVSMDANRDLMQALEPMG